MTAATSTGWALLGLAVLLMVAGAPLAGLLPALAAGLLAILAPSEDAQQARRRNPKPHARRVAR